MEAQQAVLAEVVKARRANPHGDPKSIFSAVIGTKAMMTASAVVPVEDLQGLVTTLAQASAVPVDRLPELLEGFSPGTPVPTEGAGRFAAPELTGQSRTGGALTQALNLDPGQARAMQEASRLDPEGTIAPTHKALTERGLGTGDPPPPQISGLLPEQQRIIDESWREGKPSKTMDQAMKMREQNAQALVQNETVLRAARTVIGHPDAQPGSIESGDIGRAIHVLDEAGSWAAGRGQFLRFIPETYSAELNGHLESIRSNVGIDTLLRIKASGAGLGQIPQSQMDFLAGVLGELKIGQHPDVLRANLQRVRSIYSDIVRAAEADAARFRSVLDPASAGQQNIRPIPGLRTRLRFNAQTGQLEPAQ